MEPNVSKLINKNRKGDSLSNVELMTLAERTGKAADVLFGMGDLFNLAAKEANRIFMECCDFAFERGLIKSRYDVKIISKWLEKENKK